MQCKQTGCKAYALKNDEYCFTHSQKPEVIEKRQEARKKGGAGSRSLWIVKDDTPEVKEQFITLRSQGLSIEEISKQIHVKKKALIEWEHELGGEIDNAKGLILDIFQSKYAVTPASKVELWGQIVDRLSQELSKRDLSDVPTDKLLLMLAKAQERLDSYYQKPKLRTDSEIEGNRRLFESLKF